MGLRAGWGFDLTVCDVDGRAWDFNSIEIRNRAVTKVPNDKPLLLIGGETCAVYSAISNANHARMSQEEVAERCRYVWKHLGFRSKLYQIQVVAGRYFPHERPHGASSWEETCIRELIRKQGVIKVVGDQCRYGFKSKHRQGEGLDRKRVGFMIHSIGVAQQLRRRRPNQAGYITNRHAIPEGGRTKRTHVHPRELCKAICIGSQNQIRVDRDGHFLTMETENAGATTSEFMKVAIEMEMKLHIVEEDKS